MLELLIILNCMILLDYVFNHEHIIGLIEKDDEMNKKIEMNTFQHATLTSQTAIFQQLLL